MGNEYTKYGSEKEPFAVREFENAFNVKVQSCGLFVDSQFSFLVASPDGLVGDKAIVEVKCPAKAAKLTPAEAITQKQINLAILDEKGGLVLKASHNYYFQDQGQLQITRRDYCYFIVWTPLGMLVQKVRY